ncbi:M48 family metallopeptidase [Vibrio sp. DW001]|uniref:M48 family metallopeptidase n=1 Tax=Vibrio sp. DW001 TaxID=2912315 RepID=UPI0023AECB72|nr:M48 family metallopeptidase [Vibrio sp. DW001]WED29250.1 M48 family metallopeptidase [Vibrio sp. DW001]
MNGLQKALLSSITLTLVACSSSPTGRHQIIMFSDQQMNSMGTQSFESLKKEQKISKDKKTNDYVQCVTNAILPYVAKQEGFTEWEVVVFDSEQVNAFALPGGKIGVYTGLLKVAENQDQLATVIGHEIAHVLAEHSNERMSQAQLANVGLQVTNATLNDSEYQGLAMAALGLGVQYGVLLPYGRTQESEADIVGLELMANAGFDPYQSIDLWKNMAKASGGNQPPELLSTHPSHNTRIEDLNEKANSLNKSTVQRPQCKM